MSGSDERHKASWGKRLAARMLPKHKLLRGALGALAVALVLELLMMLLEATPFWNVLTRADGDWLMRTYSGEMIHRETAHPLAFIDIDDTTWGNPAWGNPRYTDRSHVKQLIQYAAESGATAVIVDVDLSPRGDHEDELRRYLAAYGAHGELAPLIFVLRLEARSGSPSDARSALPWLGDSPWSQAALWRQNDAPVYFTSAVFLSDEGDTVVRRWRLWEPVCRNGIPVGLASVELLTLAIVYDSKHGPAKLDAAMTAATRGECKKVDRGMVRQLDFTTEKGSKIVDLDPDEVGKRILYTLPWPVSSEPMLAQGDRDIPLLVRLPAQAIIDDHPAADPVHDRIVVIGGSNTESHDSYLTPVGKMPGAMVLLNAINSLLQQGELHQLSTPFRIGVGIALGMVAWLCLYVFQFAIGVALASAVIVALVWLLSAHWISAGVWFDLGAPTLAMIAHRWVTVLERFLHDRHRYGCWRALLAPTFRRANAPGAPRRKRRHVAMALTLASGAAGYPAATAVAQAAVAGYISGIGGYSSECSIERDGNNIPVGDWIEVRDGDQVIVHGKGHIEVVQDDGAPPLIVTEGNSPLRVAARGGYHGFIPRSWEWVSQIVTQWSDARAHDREVQTMSRNGGNNGALALPLLATPVRQLIVAGTRQLTLAWVGGKPPFRVLLTGPLGTSKLDVPAGEERLVSSRTKFLEGMYEVRITDAAGLAVTGAFEATTAAPAENDRDLAGLPPGIARPLAAARLSDAQEATWHLEAYTRLAEDERNNGAARMMADRLAKGQSLSELQPH